MTLLEAVAAGLLVLGSALVILAVWVSDRAEDRSAFGPAETPPPTREEQAPLRRAA